MRTHVLVALVFLTGAIAVRGAAPVKDPYGKAYKGETCAACHNTQRPAPLGLVEESFDVVIVGAGQAGLAASHYLPDKKVVILEAEKEAGGLMRQDSWRGKKYAVGAAYLVSPYGFMRDFYDKEKVPLVKIPHPENSAWIGGKFYADCWNEEGRAKMPWTGEAMKSWLAFLEGIEAVGERNESSQPFESFSHEQRQLDRVSAYDYMKGKGLTEEQIRHIDRYIPSCFGVTSKQVSAAGFVNYMCGEIGGNYTMEGGLGAVTAHIARNHARRIRLGCRATHVVQTRDEVRVTYLGPDGRSHTIRGKTCILAIPQNLVPELMADLPQERRDVIARTRYAAYTVANVLCNEVLWADKGYDTWMDGLFFNDIIDADWITRGGKPHANKKQPHVLTLYIPLGLDGLKTQMEWSPREWKSRILADLDKVIPGASSKVADVRLSRWGHSLHVASPGFMSDVVPILRRPYYRVFFAGAEVEGLPCNESAVLSGYQAARGVRGWLWDTVPSARALIPGALDGKLRSAME